jgi:hypothetical protein
MNGWLAAAEKLFTGRAIQPPTPYELTCVCGHFITGTRSAASQRPVCPECATTLFVLPASVYPLPPAPRRKPLVRPLKKPAEADSAETAASEVAAPQVMKTAATSAPPEPRIAAGPRAVRAPRRSLRQFVGESALALKLDRLHRRVFSPVKLVLAGVLTVVALTGWWIVRLHDREEAETIVVSAARLADQALDDRDLKEAAHQFRRVCAALDLLGRSDPQARELRQSASEIVAAVDLCRASLFEMLHDANDAELGKTHLTWDEIFKLNYCGEWVVIDAKVTRSQEPGPGRRYVIEFPLADGRTRGEVVGDLEVFDHALSAGGHAQRLIFAAQLDDCRRDPQPGGAWQIVLRPNTGFLWSGAGNLELLGVPVDNETRQVLTDQSRHLGLLQRPD